MDSLTHIAVGACIGELVAGKQLGKKAMILGALAQSIPDIDFVTSWFMPVAADLLAHRGFTHSILFGVLTTLLLATLSGKMFKSTLTFKKWCFFWGIQIFMHLFLDIFNVYGTGLLEPFSHYRVSLNTFFVLDPLFSIWPVIGLIILTILKSNNKIRTKVSVTLLSVSAFYMMCAVGNKLYINHKTEQSFQTQHIKVSRYFSTPTALNNLLWYIVAQTDSGYYIGYRSVLDHKDTIQYRFVANNHALIDFYKSSETARLKRFSQGYYIGGVLHDTVVFSDLRFGEMTAGLQPNPRFSFYYYLSPAASNDVIIQRGRFSGWDKQIVNKFINRIKGN